MPIPFIHIPVQGKSRKKKQVHFPQMLFNLVWLIYIKSVLRIPDFHRGFQ